MIHVLALLGRTTLDDIDGRSEWTNCPTVIKDRVHFEVFKKHGLKIIEVQTELYVECEFSDIPKLQAAFSGIHGHQFVGFNFFIPDKPFPLIRDFVMDYAYPGVPKWILEREFQKFKERNNIK